MTEKAKKSLKIVRIVGWSILWTLFGLLLALVICIAVQKLIMKKPVPSLFGYSCLTIATGSMNGNSVIVSGGEPTQVGIGDIIVIKDTGDYEIGDVITFLQEGDSVPTTHRIIGTTDTGFITKGDANNTKDTTPVNYDDVLGEVVGHYPDLGKFMTWVRADGWIYIVCCLAILALGGVAIKLESNNHKKDDEKVVVEASFAEIAVGAESVEPTDDDDSDLVENKPEDSE